MKTIKLTMLSAFIVLAPLPMAVAQQTDDPSDEFSSDASTEEAVEEPAVEPGPARPEANEDEAFADDPAPAVPPEQSFRAREMILRLQDEGLMEAPDLPYSAPAPPETRSWTVSPRTRPAPSADGNQALADFTPPAAGTSADANGEANLRLNFRGVPLEMVLNYLSDAAGFIINAQTDIKGRVDVWSNQPLTRDEAVDVLNSVLSRNGYAAIRNGRMLTIVSRDDAKRRDIPVKAGNVPGNIPRSEEIVTQIIPVRYINAAALTRDLQPLLPSSATLTANEAGNALILTDTQINIRRMAEIVTALDTSVASISSVRVFPLQFADAKELAEIVKEVFQTPDSAQSNDPRQRFFNRFRGPGGGGGDNANNANNTTGRPGASRVTAVADERSNSLVVGAPDEVMDSVEQLIASVDLNVEEITEIRVFRLRNADPVETADLLTSLFPDETSAAGNRGQNRNQQRRFNAANDQSDRLKKQTRVLAVPDQRTQSVVVTASRGLMEQIAGMIDQLDSDPARKQKVFVYSVENTDPAAVEEVVRGLFEGQNSRARTTANSRQQPGNQLNNRAVQQQQQNQGTVNNFGAGARQTGR